MGTAQVKSIIPLPANVYLHYDFDLLVRRCKRKQARGCVVVLRFADDYVAGSILPA